MRRDREQSKLSAEGRRVRDDVVCGKRGRVDTEYGLSRRVTCTELSWVCAAQEVATLYNEHMKDIIIIWGSLIEEKVDIAACLEVIHNAV